MCTLPINGPLSKFMNYTANITDCHILLGSTYPSIRFSLNNFFLLLLNGPIKFKSRFKPIAHATIKNYLIFKYKHIC